MFSLLQNRPFLLSEKVPVPSRFTAAGCAAVTRETAEWSRENCPLDNPFSPKYIIVKESQRLKTYVLLTFFIRKAERGKGREREPADAFARRGFKSPYRGRSN